LVISNVSTTCEGENCDKFLYQLDTTVNYNSDENEVTDLEDTFLNSPIKPVIFIITPTYARSTQLADMTRLAQNLMLVKNILWIVVEDSYNISSQVSALLNRTSIPYVHLLGPRPKTHLDKRSGRGVSNRRKGLQWIRNNYANKTVPGVIYFADDDNTYDIRLFEEMRDTEKVSVWPVGLVYTLGISSPVVNLTTGKVIGFHDPYLKRRRFAVDMAGFAVNLMHFLSKPKANIPYKAGYEEDYFLRSLEIQIEDLKPKANNCTEVSLKTILILSSVFIFNFTLYLFRSWSGTQRLSLVKVLLM